jgi:hypothetical protein
MIRELIARFKEYSSRLDDMRNAARRDMLQDWSFEGLAAGAA